MKAVLFDALGTLVRLEPPAPRLVAALRERGVEVSAEAAKEAMRAEIGYYRAHHDMAGTRAGLEDVRDACASVVEHVLRTGLARADVRAALLEAIVFTPYDEVPEVLAQLESRGVALGVVSNWDVSLHDVLDEHGFRRCFGVVVTSAEVGVAKPDPRPFHVALERLGVDPAHALHVGDDLDADVGGALGAGCEGVLVVRDGAQPPAGVRAIADLTGLL